MDHEMIPVVRFAFERTNQRAVASKLQIGTPLPLRDRSLGRTATAL
jgi:hypothetical protein